MSDRLNYLWPRERLAVPAQPSEDAKARVFAASVNGHAQAVVFVPPMSADRAARHCTTRPA